MSKKSFPNLKSHRFSLMLPSRSFAVLPFTFKTIIHFYIFVSEASYELKYNFSYEYSIIPAPYFGKL